MHTRSWSLSAGGVLSLAVTQDGNGTSLNPRPWSWKSPYNGREQGCKGVHGGPLLSHWVVIFPQPLVIPWTPLKGRERTKLSGITNGSEEARSNNTALLSDWLVDLFVYWLID
jgi:hypothetical protein